MTLKYDDPLSNSAFIFNVRHYTLDAVIRALRCDAKTREKAALTAKLAEAVGPDR